MRDRSRREGDRRRTFRQPRRAGVPPHRNRNHPPARALDRARPARPCSPSAEAPSSQPANRELLREQRHLGLARLPVREGRRSASLPRATARCARWRSDAGPFRRALPGAARCLQPAPTFASRSRRTTPKASVDADPGRSGISMNTQTVPPSEPPQARPCHFPRLARCRRPRGCRDGRTCNRATSRASAISMWSARARPAPPWRAPRSACWAAASRPA